MIIFTHIMNGKFIEWKMCGFYGSFSLDHKQSLMNIKNIMFEDQC
jgi:hypothetical protein